MMKLDYHEKFDVTMENVQGTILAYHLLETWHNNKGEIYRPGGLPPVVAYDSQTGRCIYRAWPDKDGKLRKRDNGLPSEIYETEDQPHMKWYDSVGQDMFIAWPTDVKRNPKTGEIIECIYNNPPVPCTGDFSGFTPPSLDFANS